VIKRSGGQTEYQEYQDQDWNMVLDSYFISYSITGISKI
jgi:hypothetical protein